MYIKLRSRIKEVVSILVDNYSYSKQYEVALKDISIPLDKTTNHKQTSEEETIRSIVDLPPITYYLITKKKDNLKDTEINGNDYKIANQPNIFSLANLAHLKSL